MGEHRRQDRRCVYRQAHTEVRWIPPTALPQSAPCECSTHSEPPRRVRGQGRRPVQVRRHRSNWVLQGDAIDADRQTVLNHLPRGTDLVVCWSSAVLRPCRSCLPHRASLDRHALKVGGEAPPLATRSKLGEARRPLAGFAWLGYRYWGPVPSCVARPVSVRCC